jgi:hypothetical protein
VHLDEKRLLTDLGVEIGNVQPVVEGDGGDGDGDDDGTARTADGAKGASEIGNTSITNKEKDHFGEGEGESTNVVVED